MSDINLFNLNGNNVTFKTDEGMECYFWYNKDNMSEAFGFDGNEFDLKVDTEYAIYLKVGGEIQSVSQIRTRADNIRPDLQEIDAEAAAEDRSYQRQVQANYYSDKI